jgi:hypothetical protein
MTRGFPYIITVFFTAVGTKFRGNAIPNVGSPIFVGPSFNYSSACVVQSSQTPYDLTHRCECIPKVSFGSIVIRIVKPAWV